MNAPAVAPSPIEAVPQCLHFGTCGGCQYQNVAYAAQVEWKRAALQELLANVAACPQIEVVASPQPYGYRNRIRLRTETVDGARRFGYNVRATTEFLPITMCPIAAPLLWSAAESLLAIAAENVDAAFWFDAAKEVELFCNDDLTQLQITLLCPPRTNAAQGSLARFFAALRERVPQAAGIGAIASDPRTGPTGRTLDAVGTTGLLYRVADEAYWVSRGSFFQVNRFLLPELVSLVCNDGDLARSGALAWDLFAGVGLFTRVLARSFMQVTAVEAAPASSADLRAGLARIDSHHQAVAATALAFLQRAVLDRERPELVVLDPPRAGAGEEVCELLARIAPQHIVYVSCDPTTLARDLRGLQATYKIARLHVVDLFPQTAHMETVAVLERR